MTRTSKLIHGKNWATLAQKMHAKARVLYRHKTFRNRKILSRVLHEMKAMELYKDLGYVSWEKYVKEAWSTGRTTVDHYAQLHKLFQVIPDALKLAPPGFMGVRRMALLAGFVTEREDLHWWTNLCRVTTWMEYKCIVKAAKEAARCGHPAEKTFLYVGWVDETTQRRLVSRAFHAARKDLGSTASVGDCIAWACAKALGKSVPRSLGTNRPALRNRKAMPQGHPVTLGGPEGGQSQ